MEQVPESGVGVCGSGIGDGCGLCCHSFVRWNPLSWRLTRLISYFSQVQVFYMVPSIPRPWLGSAPWWYVYLKDARAHMPEWRRLRWHQICFFAFSFIAIAIADNIIIIWLWDFALLSGSLRFYSLFLYGALGFVFFSFCQISCVWNFK